MFVDLPGGLATSIGSLPHPLATAAAEFVLRLHPRLPAIPSLPRRSAAEGMLTQAAAGVTGLDLLPEGDIAVTGALDPEAPVVTDLQHAAFGGLRGFLRTARGRVPRVKWQLTGPVTFGRALVHAGVEPDVALRVAVAAVRARAGAVRDAVRAELGDLDQVVFIDEPSLTGIAHPGFPVAPSRAVAMVADVVEALDGVAAIGVHCCGRTDWGALAATGATILSMPADDAAHRHAAVIARHLDAGGWIAWGAVPTDEPIGTSMERLWRHLSDLWCELVREGCDPARLRTQAIVTPVCGLAGHGVSQAERVLRFTTQLASRVHDQAVATRMSLGA